MTPGYYGQNDKKKSYGRNITENVLFVGIIEKKKQQIANRFVIIDILGQNY